MPRQPDNAHAATEYLLAVLGAIVAILIVSLAQKWLGLADLSPVFMLAVLVVASRTRAGPAVLTAVLCFLGYNYFFIEPRFSFYIGAPQGLLTASFFLAAALLAGRMASQLAMQVRALQWANQYARARQALAQRLAVAVDETGVVEAARATFRENLNTEIWLKLEDRMDSWDDRSLLPTPPPEGIEQHGWSFQTLRASGTTLGTLGIKRITHAPDLDIAQGEATITMAEDISQALLRTRLVSDLQAERVANETERLRSALLSSVSHDLRTPLSAMIGAAESLDSYGEAMNAQDRQSLLETIRGEGERLNRYIRNLLDMTRLGHGDLVLQRDWIGVDELIGAATRRLQQYDPKAKFSVQIAETAGVIWVHPALVEQAIFNVLENAVHFSPPGKSVLVEAHRDAQNHLTIEVRDQGPGIPEDARARVFDLFYSVRQGDRTGKEGTGLGLAICRGMIGAHGGEVQALANPGGGAVIRLTLPLIEPDGASSMEKT